MTAKSQYRRLPGRSGLIIRHSLWLAPDHVLCLKRGPFSETYRRYFFTDIQALVVSELPNSLSVTGYTISALLVLISFALFYVREPVWGVLLTILVLIGLFLSWRSPNCSCYIKTSVSTEKLASLRRMRAASKTVSRLKAEIEKVQGSVARELLETEPLTLGPAAPTRKLKSYTGPVHWIAFALMLLRGVVAIFFLTVLTGTFARAATVPLSVAATVIGIAVLVLLIFAAVRQQGTDLAPAIQQLTYLAIAWYVGAALFGMGFGLYIGVQIAARKQPPMLGISPTLRAISFTEFIGYIAIGCAGLILLMRHQRTVRTPPSLATGAAG